eukprot:4143203-Pyramimonas_sp.AAC.1
MSSSSEPSGQPLTGCVSSSPLSHAPLEVLLWRAACCGAFLSALNDRCLGIAGSPAQHVEARLSVSSRRHRTLSAAWSVLVRPTMRAEPRAEFTT